jgi:hypothetical protein
MEAIWELVVCTFVVAVLGTASLATVRVFGIGTTRTR